MNNGSQKKNFPRTSMTQPMALAAGLAISGVAVSCGPQDLSELPGPQPKSAPTASAAQPLLGADGSKTVAVLSTVINTYSKVVADVKAGDTTIKVQDVGLTGLKVAAGDLVMIVQMQGAKIDATDTATYGTVSAANLGGAGKYEIVGVKAVDAATNTITLDVCTGGVKNDYSTAGHTQVVRVPQYTDLTVAVGGSITATPWDGDKGGVIAAYVLGKTTITGTGSIDASATGFRGGAVDNMSQDPAMVITTARSTNAADGAEHGESIAGYETEYDTNFNGKYGRGAPANGGGGGDSHNGGGGGGANGNNAQTWTGAGVMLAPNNTFANAWKLDPDYKNNGNALTNSSGGGRGGYSYGANANDPTAVGPGNTAWAGNNRQNAGGLGGHPVDNNPQGRLFLGGGGGAGDGNNNAAGAGGRGGGLVYLVSAGGIEGGGSILSNGKAGDNTAAGTAGNDAPGGGGAGGTIVVFSGRNLTNIKLGADGGVGGNQNIGANESEGPGGGGSGGYVSTFSQSSTGLTRSALGGVAGTTNSTGIQKVGGVVFDVNGATIGATGQPNVLVTIDQGKLMPICVPSDLAVTATHAKGTVAAGNTITLNVTVSNSGPQPASAAAITDTITAGLGTINWTCTAAGGAICPGTNGMGTGTITSVDPIPPNGSLSFTLQVPIPAGFTGFPITYNVGATVPPGFNDPNLANNVAMLSLANNAMPNADLSLTVTPTPNPAQPGLPIVYDLKVQNRGPASATGATINYNFPAGSNPMLTTIPNGWACSLAGTALTCNWNMDVPPGSLPDVMVTITPPSGAGSADSSGSVTGQGTTDPDTTNNMVTSSVPIGTFPPADIGIGINSTPNPAPQGSDVVYDLRVTNSGPNTATGANLTFNVPAGSTVKNINAPNGWTCNQVSSTISCLYALPIPVGTAPDVMVTVTPDAATTSLTASAQVAGQGVSDPNPANNTATETNPIGNNAPQADLVLTVTTSPNPPQADMPIVYTLDVSNKGPGSATGAVLTYTVPQGGTIQSVDAPTGWSCSQQDRTVSCWYNSNIDPNMAAPDIHITVVPPAGATTLDAPVQVTPKGATDPDPTNNQADVVLQLGSFKLAGGGYSFGCSAAPSGAAQPGAVAGFVTSLLGLLGLRRRRRQ